MAIDLNLGGVKRPEFKPLPEDDYTLVLTDIEIKPSKEANSDGEHTPVAHCTFEVVEPEEFANRKIWYYQSLGAKNLEFAKVWLEALYGEPLESEISIDEEALVGRHVTAHIKQVPNNKDSTKIDNKIAYFVLPFSTEE